MGSQPPSEKRLDTYSKHQTNGKVDKRNSANSHPKISRLTSTLFSVKPRSTLLSIQSNQPKKRLSAATLLENATLSSSEKWKANRQKNRDPKAADSRINGSFSESEEDDDDDLDHWNSVLGTSVDPKVKEKERIDDLLKEDSFYGIAEKSKNTDNNDESTALSMQVKNILEEDDGIDNVLDDDSFLLDTTIKDAKYYESQRKLTMELGKRNGYPEVLEEEDLKKRTLSIVPEMCAIIRGETISVYHDAAQEAVESFFIKATNSRDPDIHFKRFGGVDQDSSQGFNAQKTMSTTKAAQLEGLSADTGYYGPRGQEMIANYLFEKLEAVFRAASFNTTDEDQSKDAYCDQWWMRYFGFNNYMILVIVPETLSRLVASDRGIPINEARSVVKESTSYGMMKFPNIVIEDKLSSGISSDSGDDSFFS